jgi:hypothetical protein
LGMVTPVMRCLCHVASLNAGRSPGVRASVRRHGGAIAGSTSPSLFAHLIYVPGFDSHTYLPITKSRLLPSTPGRRVQFSPWMKPLHVVMAHRAGALREHLIDGNCTLRTRDDRRALKIPRSHTQLFLSHDYLWHAGLANSTRMADGPFISRLG